jgi:hypothetical protein
MMRSASGDECGNLLVPAYNRLAEAGVLKKPREASLTVNFLLLGILSHIGLCVTGGIITITVRKLSSLHVT